ncbi:MAG: hypothetical protein AB7V74_13520 [Acidimicrobiia bacterium]
MDIEASARKHDVTDEDMLHAFRHHWRAFATDDSEVTMFIGPRRDGRRWKERWSPMMTATRSSTRCRHVPSS